MSEVPLYGGDGGVGGGGNRVEAAGLRVKWCGVWILGSRVVVRGIPTTQ